MNSLRSALLGLYTVLLTLTLGPTGQARAETQIMTYDVYAGGIHAMDAKLTLNLTPSSYDIKLDAETAGFLKSLADWSGNYWSNGVMTKTGQAAPKQHRSSSTWKNETEDKNYRYDGKGKFVSFKVTSEDSKGKVTDKTPEKIDPELTSGSTDLLSATLKLLLALPKDKTCSGKEKIFDGDRSYFMIFKATQHDRLTKSRYNIFDGEAVTCEVEVKPDQGKWRKKPRGWLSIQEQGRQKGALPTIWLGQMGADKTYIPVKIRVKTDYGTLFMHLTSYKTGPAAKPNLINPGKGKPVK